jgi:ubiquitin-protein ligase
MGPRKRVRLQKDHEELVRLTQGRAPLISVEPSGGLPPTIYKFTVTLKGLKLDGERAIHHELHQFVLKLGANYPSEPPDVTWLTPIFHPNIRGQAVCHSQQWSPAWSLADFVVELGDMIRMDKFNVKSPLDRKAAVWADKNRQHFPVDPRTLRAPEGPKILIKPKDPKPKP